MFSKIKRSTIIPAVIALLLGLFIGKSVTNITNSSSNVILNDNAFKIGEVYLIQVGQFGTKTNATALTNELNSLSINAISVLESGIYYVYTDISLYKSILETRATGLENMGYIPIIKKVYLINCLTSLIPNSPEYNFWYKGMQYYMLLLGDKNISNISSFEQNVNSSSIDFYNNLSVLNVTSDLEVRQLLKLNTYKIFVEDI